jgi:hypothetical protein
MEKRRKRQVNLEYSVQEEEGNVYLSFPRVALWQQPLNKSPRFSNDVGVESSQQWMLSANLGYFDWSDPVTRGRTEVKWSIRQQRSERPSQTAPPLVIDHLHNKPTHTLLQFAALLLHLQPCIRTVINASMQHRCQTTTHLRPYSFPSIIRGQFNK